MKKYGFLREANGQYSIARLALFIANLVMIFSIAVWGIISLHTNVVHEFPANITILVCSANGWKALQKFAEEKCVTETGDTTNG